MVNRIHFILFCVGIPNSWTSAAVPECKVTDLGTEYRGVVNVTKSGRTCQRWDKNTPHRSNFLSYPENYCRNPDDTAGGPWCYTTDFNVRWEFCNIPYCAKVTAASVEFHDTSTTEMYLTTSTNDLTAYQPTTRLSKQTTSSSEQATSSSEQCSCSCNPNVKQTNFTKAELKEILKNKLNSIEEFLTIDKSSTSTSIRRHTSATDNRRSSTGMGFVAIAIICIPPVLMIFSDCSRIISTSVQWCKMK